MHHPSEDIPWHLLASNLHWAPGKLAPQIRDLNLPQVPGKLKDKEGCECGATNLHPNSPAPRAADKPDEFINAFSKAVSDASKLKRAQYPEKYSVPNPSDILLGDELFKKVDSLLSREVKGGPRLPSEQRTAYAFLHPWECGWDRDEHCQVITASTGGIGFLNLEVVKILLMLGELGPILQACAHPGVGLQDWYEAAICDCETGPYHLGWEMVLFCALDAYIVLNVALCFPEMYDPAAGRTDETDYRHTAFYQCMLREATGSYCPSEATPYPHQRFFGIPSGYFTESTQLSKAINPMHWLHRTDILKRADPYGLFSFDEFLNLEGSLKDQYQPLESDVELVKLDLFSKGLPYEIVVMIMDFADYKAKRVLKIPHDPLHPANRAELDLYLDQCWQMIIGCSIMNNTIGEYPIDWQDIVQGRVRYIFHKSEKHFISGDSISGLTCSGI